MDKRASVVKCTIAGGADNVQLIMMHHKTGMLEVPWLMAASWVAASTVSILAAIVLQHGIVSGRRKQKW